MVRAALRAGRARTLSERSPASRRRLPQPRRRSVATTAAVAIIALAGCASSSIQTEASEFVQQHGAAATQAAAATNLVELRVSGLSGGPASAGQLEGLAHAAASARRATVGPGEWSIAAGGEGGGAEEEEDLPRAETQVTNGANELRHAATALQAYTRAPSAAALARYRTELAGGREQWDEGISEIWHLAHRSHPPTV